MKTTLLILLVGATAAAAYQSPLGRPMVAQPPGAYFGVEFAEAQRALESKPKEEMPATF